MKMYPSGWVVGLIMAGMLAAPTAGLAQSAAGEAPQTAAGNAEPRPKEFGGGGNILSIPSSGFLPYDSGVTYVYANAGYRSRTGTGSLWFDAPVVLPSGALVETIELEACDDSATNEISLILYDCGTSPTSGCGSVATAATGVATVPGCGYFPVNLPAPITVDNFVGSYFLRIQETDVVIATRFRGARIVWRRQVSPAPAVASFTDVPTTHPQFRFVEALAGAGVTGGCGGGAFCPDAALTRGQMAVFLSAALGLHWPN